MHKSKKKEQRNKNEKSKKLLKIFFKSMNLLQNLTPAMSTHPLLHFIQFSPHHGTSSQSSAPVSACFPSHVKGLRYLKKYCALIRIFLPLPQSTRKLSLFWSSACHFDLIRSKCPMQKIRLNCFHAALTFSTLSLGLFYAKNSMTSEESSGFFLPCILHCRFVHSLSFINLGRKDCGCFTIGPLVSYICCYNSNRLYGFERICCEFVRHSVLFCFRWA